MRIVLAAVLVLGACGNGDVDLSGVYRVTSEVSSMPCGTDAPVTGGAAYLHFKKDELLGTPYFMFDECNDEAAMDCPHQGSVFSAFSLPTDDGWDSHITSWSGAGGQCGLSVEEGSAVLKGNTLTIDITDHSGEIALPDSQCDKDAPDDHVDELECTEHHAFTGVKL